MTLFEKSRGVSGRLSTRVRENWQCDHGAQYFTARDPLFNAEVERWVNAHVAQLWQPSLKVFDGENFLPKEDEKKSQTLRYVGYPQNSAPAKWLAKSLNVLTEHTVNSIHQQANQWQVNSKEHGLHPQSFDFLILSQPAPQAAMLLNSTQSTLASACNAVLMQPCFALMLHTNQAINCQFDGLFINTGLLSWVARDSSKPGRSQRQIESKSNSCSDNNHLETWVLHATSQWSKRHIEDEKNLVAQEMLKEFTKILQYDASIKANGMPELALQSYELHCWLYADCEHYLVDGYQLDAQLNIGLCGDWLNGGKVQGAWLSGLKLANELIMHCISQSHIYLPH